VPAEELLARHGILTKRRDELTNEFFVTLLDMNTDQ